jgi:hypothetical protein
MYKKFPLEDREYLKYRAKKPHFFQKTNNHIIPYKLINLRFHKNKRQ